MQARAAGLAPAADGRGAEGGRLETAGTQASPLRGANFVIDGCRRFFSRQCARSAKAPASERRRRTQGFHQGRGLGRLPRSGRDRPSEKKGGGLLSGAASRSPGARRREIIAETLRRRKIFAFPGPKSMRSQALEDGSRDALDKDAHRPLPCSTATCALRGSQASKRATATVAIVSRG